MEVIPAFKESIVWGQLRSRVHGQLREARACSYVLCENAVYPGYAFKGPAGNRWRIIAVLGEGRVCLRMWRGL